VRGGPPRRKFDDFMPISTIFPKDLETRNAIPRGETHAVNDTYTRDSYR
jgi:hypothetical protein